ncbi:Arc family DNA-binding protein [Pseudomonas cedrina]|jgi:seryl-tRNA synthetase|uniref:Arc family DNA-binding protein n=1 Tax=Pseudomonas cedrina TaxID=651740 RepID=UPI003EDB49DE
MDKDDRYTRITLRIPKELHERLADSADQTSKSMNAEIIARLSESFTTKSVDDRAVDRVSELDRQIADLTVESYRLMREAGSISELMELAGSKQEKSDLFNQMNSIMTRVGHVEVSKQRLVKKITEMKR